MPDGDDCEFIYVSVRATHTLRAREPAASDRRSSEKKKLYEANFLAKVQFLVLICAHSSTSQPLIETQ